MTATPAEAADFRELLGQLAVELVRPVNDSLRQLYELLRDPAPVVSVAGSRLACQSRTVASTDGIVQLLAPDPSRLGYLLNYDNTPGNVAIYAGAHPAIGTADSVVVPQVNNTRWVPSNAGLWVFSTGAGRSVQVAAVYR